MENENEQHVGEIEALSPDAIDATIRKQEGRHIVTVYRRADDGYCGWRFQVNRANKRAAIDLALQETQQRLENEQQRTTPETEQ